MLGQRLQRGPNCNLPLCSIHKRSHVQERLLIRLCSELLLQDYPNKPGGLCRHNYCTYSDPDFADNPLLTMENSNSIRCREGFAQSSCTPDY